MNAQDTHLESLMEKLSFVIEPPFLYYAIIAVLALFVILTLLVKYRRSHKGIVPFKSQGGSIEIAPQTLRGILQHAVNSVEGVEKAACRHFHKGRSIGVKVAIQLRANHPLREVETTIKKRIRATLLDQFGMETVDPIHIRVTRIIGDPMASVPALEEQKTYAIEAEADDLPEPDETEDDRPYSDETRL